MRRPRGAAGLTPDNARAESAREPVGTAVELFAGVGGFRLGLEGVPEPFRKPGDVPGRWSVKWANQWEPPGVPTSQHAFNCYVSRFPDADGAAVNKDIAEVRARDIPRHDLLVGGFPCQDYSVAKPLNQAHGIQGRKGVLWWEIHRILRAKRPKFVLLENVDRLLKSPGTQRGRDFAMILATMSGLGYLVEWRVVNAAEYGYPQRRRRVFIVGRHVDSAFVRKGFDGFAWIASTGVLARALPCELAQDDKTEPFVIEGKPHEVSAHFGEHDKVSRFANAGVMLRRRVWTRKAVPSYAGPYQTLGDVMQHDSDVPTEFIIPADRIGAEVEPDRGTWRQLKGSKQEDRVHKGSGVPYRYAEGALPFPDWTDRAARTVLTGEGGAAPSRFKHVVPMEGGRFRRLTPVELERLNGFPDGWTEGMPDTRRAFCMGNALVVGVVRQIGAVIADDLAAMKSAGD